MIYGNIFGSLAFLVSGVAGAEAAAGLRGRAVVSPPGADLCPSWPLQLQASRPRAICCMRAAPGSVAVRPSQWTAADCPPAPPRALAPRSARAGQPRPPLTPTLPMATSACNQAHTTTMPCARMARPRSLSLSACPGTGAWDERLLWRRCGSMCWLAAPAGCGHLQAPLLGLTLEVSDLSSACMAHGTPST